MTKTDAPDVGELYAAACGARSARPDTKNIQVGDVVHVRVPVTQVDDWSIRGADGWLSKELIVHIEPRPLKVGDRVKWRGDMPCEVRAIEGKFAWVRVRDEYTTVFADECERIPNTCGGANA
jgi:hypothetical protein